MKFLEFKVAVAELLLKSDKSEDYSTGISTLATRSSSGPRPLSQSCFLQNNKPIEHFPAIASDLKNSMRCKNQGCKQKTKVFCEFCDVFLCLTGHKNCFKEFHLK
ncbi:unnamed protein product [Acanthoscelides obtectus]|uniref:Uncharacterized protein n=1 Tax=Acanthoscelides obtectus TaxID=200917 RepID=A0A9P0NUX5_ACAOB|nr:unnamed protein product [Acanthoscelides obtectus]CAK1668934.1 hypothetical protein AOBTE_LOCUS26696 [Acanthoscelides obtectus]